MTRQLKFVLGIALIVSSIGLLVYSAVDQTKMYMITVGEYLTAGDSYAGTTVRIAGRVAPDSMQWDARSRELRFTLHDIERDGAVTVHYTGLLPDMFSEGRDVIVEGPFTDAEVFEASQVLTSCPSKYEAEAGQAGTGVPGEAGYGQAGSPAQGGQDAKARSY